MGVPALSQVLELRVPGTARYWGLLFCKSSTQIPCQTSKRGKSLTAFAPVACNRNRCSIQAFNL